MNHRQLNNNTNKQTLNNEHDSDDLFSLDSKTDDDKKDEQIVNNIINNYELKKKNSPITNHENTIRLTSNNKEIN